MSQLNLTNLIAALAFISIAVSLFSFSKKEVRRRSWFKIILTLVIGFAILIATFLKNNRDIVASRLSQAKSASLNMKSDSINAMLSKLNNIASQVDRKIDTIGSLTDYINKLDSLGIKRNYKNNSPIITKSFINYINRVETLNQN